jgi:hypothetical protein
MTKPVDAEVHDPDLDYVINEDSSAPTPADRDDVDVPLSEGKETQDGKGDEEPPASDFQGYADPSADQEVQN